MKELLPENLYAVAYKKDDKWIIVKYSIHLSYEKTKKWIEENFAWIKGKEYLIVRYQAK